MQTNAISSKLVRSRKNLCETPKHDRILMYTNWSLLLGPSAARDAGAEERVSKSVRQSGLYDKPGESGTAHAHFPLPLLEKAVTFKCLEGQASQPQDKVEIIKSINR